MESDYIVVGTKRPIDMFLAKLSEKVLEYTQKHKPFDDVCAKMEFRDKLEQAEKESERRHGFVKVDEIKIDVADLDKYGDENRFEFLEDQEDYQDRVVEGSRTQVILGHTLKYKCKLRGHGISVFIPIAEYNEMKRKKEK